MTARQTRSSASTKTSKRKQYLTASVSTVDNCHPECGFGSTEIMAFMPARDKLYWHKGKGILACIDTKEDKETEFADTISGRKE